MYETTTSLLEAAIKLKEQAHQVTNREDHRTWWDVKTTVYIEIYNALESGAFTGEAHDELKQAQLYIIQAELIAAEYSLHPNSEEVEPQRLSLETWENIFINLQENNEYIDISWVESSNEYVLHCEGELFEDGFKTELEAQKRLDTLERHFAQYID